SRRLSLRGRGLGGGWRRCRSGLRRSRGRQQAERGGSPCTSKQNAAIESSHQPISLFPEPRVLNVVSFRPRARAAQTQAPELPSIFSDSAESTTRSRVHGRWHFSTSRGA